MAEVFIWLSEGITDSASVALASAFVWGVLSVILSPCHLVSLPLVVGYINRGEQPSPRGALVLSSLFTAGLLATTAVAGIITALAGRMMGDTGIVGSLLVPGVLILLGLNLMEILPMPLFNWDTPAEKSSGRGMSGAFVMGLVFGLALGPCTFAFMAPVLGVAFTMASTETFLAVALVVMYGIGHGLVIIAGGTSAGLVEKYLAWNRKSRLPGIIKKTCGLLVVIGGLYLLATGPFFSG